jgi:hypothetical protein
MRIIGGEADLIQTRLNEYFTDSGRSSLKLLLHKLKTKKFLVPNYLCEIMIKIFNEFGIDYSFYNINSDLLIDTASIEGKNYEVLYVINYFGQNHDLCDFIDQDTIVVEDNVFLPQFENSMNIDNWAGFNSFRKISPIADGSLIKSTFKLPDELIKENRSDFAQTKYMAKDMKYQYIKDNRYSEEEYLALFKQAENKLDMQEEIYNISSHSLFRLFDFMGRIEQEYSARIGNFNVLDSYLSDKSVKIKTKFPSFYILSVGRRDELREYLFSKKIFLPVHWPSINGVSSDLCKALISIPVDSRYNEEDMSRIAGLVNEFYMS